jgi:hypothetical protein
MNEFAKPNLAVDQIPSSSVSDSGKALVVGQNGVPGWAEVGGGSGGGGVLVVNWDTQTMTLDKTWQEIYDADFAVIVGRFDTPDEISKVFPYIQEIVGAADYYIINIADFGGGAVQFITDSPDGYPAVQGGG